MADAAAEHLTRELGVEPGWAWALAPVADRIRDMGPVIAARPGYQPPTHQVLRAFTYPFDMVRVLIVGQDPYPTPGHAVGLSFSVAPDVAPLPKSLQNIFAEYSDDLGLPAPATGDLTPWSQRGVCLLNRSLTVDPGAPASHRGLGWETVTEQAVRALAARGRPLVTVLWGRQAQDLEPLLLGGAVVKSPHPSPLSAHRGFFGSRPFTRVNEMLLAQGSSPIDWRLP